MNNKEKHATNSEQLLSRKELKTAILEIEHELLTSILGKNNKSEDQDGFSDEGLVSGMSMITIFADRLLEEFPVNQ